MPWINTTTVNPDEKCRALKYLSQNYPDLLWKIIFHLLPNINNWTSGCKKPDYYTHLMSNYKQRPSREEYVKQLSDCSEIVLELMKINNERIISVLNNLKSINSDTRSKIFTYLLSFDLNNLSSKDKFNLWKETSNIIWEHRKFITADWSYDEETLNQIEKFNEKLEPDSILDLYKPLFEKNELDITDEVYDDSTEKDWNEIRKKSKEIRENALTEIIEKFGFEGLISLFDSELIASNVATTLAEMNYDQFDSILFPEYLLCDDKYISAFIFQYIRVVGTLREDKWINELNIKKWNKAQILNFLIYLPFEEITWNAAKKYLKEEYIEYWKQLTCNPYSNNSDLNISTLEFIKCERIDFAMKCVYFSIISERPIQEKLIIQVLQKNVNHPNALINNHEIITIFKYLEKSRMKGSDELSSLEFTYYPFFRMSYEKLPETLYKKIKSSPEFYMQLISYVYKKENQTEEINYTEEQKAIAQISWNILNNYKLIPGIKDDNTFKSEEAINWIDDVCKLAKESNRLSITKINLGNLFFYTPNDTSLWINKEIAQIFDKLENEEMRRGFSTEAINSRGAHFYDPSGESEKEIASSWNRRAEELEEIGLYNFAQTAKDIANTYIQFANNNIMNG